MHKATNLRLQDLHSNDKAKGGRMTMSTRKLNVEKGERYNLLTIIREVKPLRYGKYKKRMFLCRCDCGNETEVRLEYIRRGHTKSCGCKREVVPSKIKRTHGMSNERIYGIWSGMKNRCYNKNVKSYENYGAKGVVVCDKWHAFESFYTWAINNDYDEHLTIERIDPFGNYEPGNCTWIPKSEQGKNKRSNYKGEINV